MTAVLTVVPFVVIPVAIGSAVTLLLVNIFPARRARDILMLMGLLFVASLVLLLRFIRPEQLLQVESLPDITDFFATLQSPLTPLLPSFWAGETLFASLQGGCDLFCRLRGLIEAWALLVRITFALSRDAPEHSRAAGSSALLGGPSESFLCNP